MFVAPSLIFSTIPLPAYVSVYPPGAITTSKSQNGASLVAQLVKNAPAVLETLVRFLSREDPLEEGMAICSNILAWRIPWTEEPGGLQSIGSQRLGHD